MGAEKDNCMLTVSVGQPNERGVTTTKEGASISQHEKLRQNAAQLRSDLQAGQKSKRPRSRCEHNKHRRFCHRCKLLGTGGSEICEHDTLRRRCKQCKVAGTGGEGLCEHNSRKERCR